MKKEYNAPVAEMMEFDYEENVVASGETSVVPNELVDVNGDKGNGKGCHRCN